MPKMPLQVYVSSSLFFLLTSGLISVVMSLGGKRSPFTELGQSVIKLEYFLEQSVIKLEYFLEPSQSSRSIAWDVCTVSFIVDEH